MLRIGVIVAGVLLSYMITSRSGADETFVEGQERYGALLDGLFYIIYFVGIACATRGASISLQGSLQRTNSPGTTYKFRGVATGR